MKKKILSSALIGGLVMGLGAGVASAAPVIDPDADGSLTIHKFEQPVVTGNSNGGLEITDTSGLTGLNDITFTVTPINSIDLTTNAGWTAFSGLAKNFDPSNPTTSIEPHTLDTTKTQTGTTEEVSGQDGVVKFDLPIGAYLVQETNAPSNVTKSLPFLVTVPVTDPTTNGWQYNVHAYPKNVVTEVEKTVTDNNAYDFGDTVTFTIIGSIPGGGVTDKYVITDQLDSKLDVENTGAVTVKAGATNLQDGTDFNYTVNNNLVTITLTQSGREAIYAALQANSEATVVATIETNVNESGVITNQATLFPNESSVEGVPSNKVTTKWGGIEVLKFSADDNNKDGLAGAVFEVYGAKKPLTDSNQLPEDAVKLTDLPGMTNGTLTTPASGKLTVDGLRYSDFANNSAQTTQDSGYNYYFLKEIKAPDGYNLLANPVQFTVTEESSAVTVEIANSPIISYPGSGSNGTAWIVIAGIAVLLTGGGIAIANHRKVSAGIVE